MAEGVLFNVAQGMIDRLISLGIEEIGLLSCVNDELKNLEKTVGDLKAVLLDAERKQANTEIKRWLHKVEDAIYEADDVLDEFYTEAQWRQIVPGNKSKQVRIFFSTSNQLAFRLKMAHKIKDINPKLKAISSERNLYRLEVNHEDKQFIIRERVNHSFVLKEDIIGRDEDKNSIVQLLLDPISTENVSTNSIVGLGGLGKTALAQLVFNDDAVQNHFELKMWICVSTAFELNILVEKIIESATNEKPKDCSMDQLQKILRQQINGKRYLLVLDDVWNESREKWLSVKNLLMGGANGSRILITTRNVKVANISETATEPYVLRGLDEKKSWSLFMKMAFKDGKEPENLRIKAAGEEIARKCRGVPLAIRTVGGMLYDNHVETEWLDLKDKKFSKLSQGENDILQTLKLSYDVLPSHLKHCFAYCSLFPPDYEISVERLIKLWVAQGFIKSSAENECLEDVGYKYYKELLWRSFFQEEKTDGFGVIKSCKMHDLMNELAVLVSGVESVIIDVNQKNFDEKHRHVSFNWDVDSSKWKIPTSMLKARNIRTFLLLKELWMGDLSFDKSFCATIASNFKSMRMLNLNTLGIVALPKCIRKLKHLRYLDLSENPIKKLPNWVVRLQNLQTLDLSGCQDLVELPRDIWKLINLRHLNLEDCFRLARIPRGLGELTCLRTLGTFVLSHEDNSVGLSELGMLKDLRGGLRIQNLRHRKDGERESNDAARLKEKHHLSALSLKWTDGEEVDGVDENEIIMSMEALQPHSNLKYLEVNGYRGVRLGSWLSSLVNIVGLIFWRCDRCHHLPPLDHLPSLKYLDLIELKNLEYISDRDSDDMTSASSSTSPTPFFISLEAIDVLDCPNLKGWWRVQSSGSSSTATNLSLPLPSFPNLEEIELTNTSWKVLPFSFVTKDVLASSSLLPKLRRLTIDKIEDMEVMPEGICNLISLQSLRVRNCRNLSSLTEGISNLASLKDLEIRGCSSLASLPQGIGNLTSLQVLKLFDFPNLTSLPQWICNLTSLRKLEISNFSDLASVPEWMRGLTSLKELRIYYCPMLGQRCKKETGEDWPNIAHIPDIYIYPEPEDQDSVQPDTI